MQTEHKGRCVQTQLQIFLPAQEALQNSPVPTTEYVLKDARKMVNKTALLTTKLHCLAKVQKLTRAQKQPAPPPSTCPSNCACIGTVRLQTQRPRSVLSRLLSKQRALISCSPSAWRAAAAAAQLYCLPVFSWEEPYCFLPLGHL